jgi:hypothetical protein
MPTTLPLLLRRCHEMDYRASPDCSQHDSDNDSIADDDVDFGNFRPKRRRS